MMPFILLGLLLASPPSEAAPIGPKVLETYPDTRGMPPDVQDFIIRWQDCMHWLGEEPYDRARREEIDAAIAKVCAGVDAAGREVRRRHADNPAVLNRIADYEAVGE